MSVKQLYLIALPIIVACAPAPGTSGAAGSPTARRSSSLAAAEMQANNVDVGTAYDAISRLRPNWLTYGTRSFDPPTTERPIVFVDGARYGELDSLRSLDARHIAEIRFYSPAEAGRFGLQGGLSGVIEVTMKK
jgi:hypothetical protein